MSCNIDGMTLERSDDIVWVWQSPEFGTAHPHGCCAAFVNGTACGWPRRADGTCPEGHPAQPPSAPVHTIGDLRAAERVRLSMSGLA